MRTMLGLTRLRPRATRGGFTLLEVLIASSVIVIALLAAYSSQISSLGLLKTTRDNNTAMAELTAAMEMILTEPVDDIPIAGSEYEANQAIVAFNDRSLRNERIVATYPNLPVGGAIPDLLEITLTLTWTDWSGRQRNMTLRSAKAR